MTPAAAITSNPTAVHRSPANRTGRDAITHRDPTNAAGPHTGIKYDISLPACTENTNTGTTTPHTHNPSDVPHHARPRGDPASLLRWPHRHVGHAATAG